MDCGSPYVAQVEEKNKAPDAGFMERVQQYLALANVVVVVARRVGNRLRDQRQRRKVDARRDVLFPDDPANQVTVADVADIERHRCRNGRPVAARKVVQNGHRTFGPLQVFHSDAADIPGAAGDENRHREDERVRPE